VAILSPANTDFPPPLICRGVSMTEPATISTLPATPTLRLQHKVQIVPCEASAAPGIPFKRSNRNFQLLDLSASSSESL
jgi:hypothetical protein